MIRAAVRSVPRSIPDPDLHERRSARPSNDPSAGSPVAPGMSLGDKGAHLDRTVAGPMLPHTVVFGTAHDSPTASAHTDGGPHNLDVPNIPQTSVVRPAGGDLAQGDGLSAGDVIGALPERTQTIRSLHSVREPFHCPPSSPRATESRHAPGNGAARTPASRCLPESPGRVGTRCSRGHRFPGRHHSGDPG